MQATNGTNNRMKFKTPYQTHTEQEREPTETRIITIYLSKSPHSCHN